MIAWILALTTVSLDTGAIVQRVSLQPALQTVATGDTATVTIVYDSVDPELTGLGVRVHYDSSKIALESSEVLFTKDTHGAQDQDDEPDFDGDPGTDRRLLVAWSTFNGVWPGPDATLPLPLAKLTFRTRGVYPSTRLNVTGVHCADCSLETHAADILIAGGGPTSTATTTPAPGSTQTPTRTPTLTRTPTITLTPSPGPSPTGWPPPHDPFPYAPPSFNGLGPATAIPTTSHLGLLVLACAVGGYALVLLLRHHR